MTLALVVGPREIIFEDADTVATDITSLVLFVGLPGYILATNGRIKHHLRVKFNGLPTVPTRNHRRVFTLNHR